MCGMISLSSSIQIPRSLHYVTFDSLPLSLSLSSQKRGEITVKGKGIMTTYWVLGKGISASQISSPGPMQAGIPQSQASTLQRQTSHHSSLAAVVFGMMQASKRSNICSTRKFTNFIPFYVQPNDELFRVPSTVSELIVLSMK